MRRYPAAVALCLCALTGSSIAGASPPGRSADALATECIQASLESFVEQARDHRAQFRIEVATLDDPCGQTLEMVLWKAPDGRVAAEGLLADHISIREAVIDLRRAHPEWPERSVCDALSLRRSETVASEMPKLAQLAGELEEMLLHPVLEPLLVIHGLQYEIRIESGISESKFSFHAPGHPRPPAEELHPLDRWSQELRHALGLRCDQAPSTGATGSGVSEVHENP